MDIVALVIDLFPRRAHVEQVDEVVAQRSRAIGEDAMFRPAMIGAEHAQAADGYGHLCCGEAEQR